VEKLLTPDDLAELCEVPVKTIYTWNSAGTAPRRIKVGKHVRYRESDVEQWLATRPVVAPA
jgi:excisionase family DNA binding protein